MKSAPTEFPEEGRLLVGGLFKPDRLAREGSFAVENRSHEYAAPTKNKT